MNLKKRFAAALLAATVGISSLNGAAVAEQVVTSIDAYYAPIHFEFDGRHFAPPEGQKGFIYEGSTYVPLRFVAYSLDKAVEWNQDTYTVTIREPSKLEQVTIQEYKMNRELQPVAKLTVDASKLKPTSIPVYFEKVTYVFDGKEKQPSEGVPGLIYEGSLYVPMRFVSESIGKEIGWDAVTYTVKASTAGKTDKPATEPTPAASATPAPSATPSPGSGGTNGGGVEKPDQSTLKADIMIKLYLMQSEAQSMKEQYKREYLNAKTPEEKQAIQEKATSYEAQVTSNANLLIDSYEQTLRNNGYDTAPADEIRKEVKDRIEKEKASVKK